MLKQAQGSYRNNSNVKMEGLCTSSNGCKEGSKIEIFRIYHLKIIRTIDPGEGILKKEKDITWVTTKWLSLNPKMNS